MDPDERNEQAGQDVTHAPKIWSDPVLIEYDVDKVTADAVGPGDDGIFFS